MNIAFFTNNYLPNVYGVPVSLETFRHEFEKMGHTVYIFAPNFPGYADKNKHVFRYPSLDINIKFRLPLGIPYSRETDKILESLDLDIIHSHHPNLLGTAATKWAQKKNIPLVFTWHTLYDQYTNFVPFLPAKLCADWIIKRAVKYANEADVVVVPTGSVVPVIQKWGVENKIVPITTGVVEKELANPNKTEIREKYGIKENEILLLLVSRLTAEKNIRFLFEAVLEILQKNKEIHPVKSASPGEIREAEGQSPNFTGQGGSASQKFNGVKFMLVGDGYLALELKAKAKTENLEDKIIFTGLADRENLKNYYAAGDIFVYASKSETQGMIITEAMYMGLPIVAVKATGIESLVEDNVNGILVPEEKGRFIKVVEKLIEDESLRKKMAAESARIAREKYTSKILAEKMLEVYEEAIEKK